MPLVDCPDPDCRHRFDVDAQRLWHRCPCPRCGAEGAAIPNRWAKKVAQPPWPANDGLAVVLEDLRSAFNVGSILRTCDAFAVSLVVLAGVTAPSDHPKVAKTALGAERSVRTVTAASAAPVVRSAVDAGWSVVALEATNRAVPLGSGLPSAPLAVVVGNEVAGISSPVLDVAQVHLQIPMTGVKTSLNVAVACGIALFTVAQQLDVIPGLGPLADRARMTPRTWEESGQGPTPSDD